jgi:hypothetical protein
MFLITFELLGYSKMISIIQIHILVNEKYFGKDFLCKICVLVTAFYCNFFLGVLAENLRGLALFPLFYELKFFDSIDLFHFF